MNLSLILYSLMVLIVLHSIGRQKSINSYLKKMGFAGTKLVREIKYTVLLLFLMFTVTIITGIILFNFGFSSDMNKVQTYITAFNLIDVLVVMGVASFVEEIFFRGFLQRKTNILVASFIFAYFHIVYSSFSELIMAFFLGLILGWGFEKSKNLFSPILAHYLYNLITVAIMFAGVSS